MGKRFIKKNEDFTCLKCGAQVASLTDGGCRNHCPVCLYSLHLDINPGDRAASCGGLMRPISFEHRGGEDRILQKCNICGFERWNKAASDDEIITNYDKIFAK